MGPIVKGAVLFERLAMKESLFLGGHFLAHWHGIFKDDSIAMENENRIPEVREKWFSDDKIMP